MSTETQANQKVRLLIVGAHPDDPELMAGGTMAKMVALGYSVGILDLTRGEMGTLGTPETRAMEAEASRKVLGVKLRRQLDLGDTMLSTLRNPAEAVDAIATVYRELEPGVVILPTLKTRHPDHEAAAELGLQAIFMAGVKNRLSIKGKPHRPQKVWHAPVTDPVEGVTFAHDITGFFEQKRQAIRCFASQFGGDTSALAELNPAWARLLDWKATESKFYGHLTGVEYAEPFVSKGSVFPLNSII